MARLEKQKERERKLAERKAMTPSSKRSEGDLAALDKSDGSLPGPSPTPSAPTTPGGTLKSPMTPQPPRGGAGRGVGAAAQPGEEEKEGGAGAGSKKQLWRRSSNIS